MGKMQKIGILAKRIKRKKGAKQDKKRKGKKEQKKRSIYNLFNAQTIHLI